MTRLPFTFTPMAVALCLGATSPAFAADIGGEWQLLAMNAQAASPGATISFDADGKFSGKAPCNRYFGSYGGEAPQITLSQIGATRMACDRMEEEARYFSILEGVTTVHSSADRLILVSTGKDVLEFIRTPVVVPPAPAE